MSDSKKVFNFSPGPAKLPEPVLERIQRELRSYESSGISVLEMSHRAKEFQEILNSTEGLFREIMGISQEYAVLFLPGGGTGQFASVPLNLMHLSKGEKPSADYVITGTWSGKAAKEGEKYLIAHKCINPTLHHFTRIPEQSHWLKSEDAAFLYYCANETVHGVEFNFVPEALGSVPVVGDISSNFVSRPIDVSKHGILFGGTQKNIGAAGLTIAIVRKDLIGGAHKMCPSIFDYKEQQKMQSVFNTPPCFGIYVTKLVMDWVKEQGGVTTIAERNLQKSKLIYEVIDDSCGFYHCPIQPDCRSRMNVSFRVGSETGVPELEKLFISESEKRGMISLKGHRSVGGMRASLYNAVTVEETEVLRDFMREFLEEHGRKEP